MPLPDIQRPRCFADLTLRGAMVGWAVWLVGCAGLPARDAGLPALAMPAGWSGEASPTAQPATSLAAWWQRFNDPQLTALVIQALQANPTARGAQAALLQARALRDVTAAGLGPTLGGSASAQRGTSGGNSTGSSYRAGLDASWELDIFGANRSALQGADATANASAASLGDVQRSIAAEVALAYITLRSTELRLAIANNNLALQLETLQITDWRLQAGLVSSLEAEQARASAEQTRAQLPSLQITREQTRHALAVLTGQPPAALNGVLAAPGALPEAPRDLAVAIPVDALRQRPDVRAAEFQVSAAWSRVAQADAARLPNFRLGGSLGLSALTLGALTNGASVVSSLLASVSLPIFDGGASAAQVRAQQAALDQAKTGYEAALLTALQEVEDALVALRGDRERLARLQLAADAATNAALLARQRYSSGLVDFQTVLDTQRTQLSTQDGVASAAASVSTDHVRLYKALGGGWQPETLPTLTQLTDRSSPP
jgi:outer membrane protein, multidrug efflux system